MDLRMGYRDYGLKTQARILNWLKMEGVNEIPSQYADFMKLDHQLRKFIGCNFPLVLSDNYEHFMACLPNKKFAAQQVLIRKQIGGFTTVAGFWKWLEFLSQRVTDEYVELAADFFSGEHNGYPRQFNKPFWKHVVKDYGGYLPLYIECIGEGATFTGVPFPVAQVLGETPAVWLNEPLYIQIGQLTHVATIAAQFAEVLGDPKRFIEVAFRALQNKEFSDDMLLAMLIGGGIISTSNDLGAFINGFPFKCAGTTGHCWYQQYGTLKEALKVLLSSPLGPYATVLLDVYSHDHGFKELQELIKEGYKPPFAERPDSGDVISTGLKNLETLEDDDVSMNVVIEDGKNPADTQLAEARRIMMNLLPERLIYGAGGGFLGARSVLEAAYKACCFFDGTMEEPTDSIDTMKICLDDPMKGSLPGMISWLQNKETGIYQIGGYHEKGKANQKRERIVLFDNLKNPGEPYFCPDYDPQNLTRCLAVRDGIDRSKRIRGLLGSAFTTQIGGNKNAIGLTKELRMKKKAIFERALALVGK